MLLFAGILVVSSANLLMEGEEDHGDSSQLENNTVLKIAKWMCDSTDYYDGEKFFTLVRFKNKMCCFVSLKVTVEEVLTDGSLVTDDLGWGIYNVIQR